MKMSKQISTVLPDDLLDKIGQVLEEKRKTDPMVTRADVLREIIRNGLPPGKPLAISHMPKVKA